jgi:putative DNA methylase
MTVKSPKKLIEVALPLDIINIACTREKSIRHGHPSTLHLWWARRPLAAARAVIFSQMVNDPSWKWEMEHPGEIPPSHLKASWAANRKRLFKIIEDLVLWENTTNEVVLERARNEIRKSWRETCELNKEHPQSAELFNPEKLPAFHDPFAGGGAIPLEAQRLGLETYASDLNPVAVLINKAMIEIPPKFAGQAPVGPIPKNDTQTSVKADWPGATGLAEDVRRYGAWMREEAFKRIGHLYPKVQLPEEYGGAEVTVIAWLWARTVKSPNPAFSHVDVPLVSTFILSSKAGKEAYVQPVIEVDSYRFEVKTGTPPKSAKNGTKVSGKGAGFYCIFSGSPIDGKYIKTEAQAGRLGQKLLAVVVQGYRGRIYIAPTPEMGDIAHQATPNWKPNQELVGKARDQMPLYGMYTFGDLFTLRQLVALTTFSDLVAEMRERVKFDAMVAGISDDGDPLAAGGTGAAAYADAIGVYLGMAVSKMSDAQSSLCRWKTTMDQSIATFGRQALPMVWDYSEANAFGKMAGDPLVSLKNMMRVVEQLPTQITGHVEQADVQSQTLSDCAVVSTDPPYYDNIGYADLSDFFYVWLRRSLKSVFPDLFATLAVPKAEELVATPYRHGSKEKAEVFFLNGMTKAMQRIVQQAHSAFPATIYYAFKQSDTSESGTGNTGWETFLAAVLKAGFALTGTWPMRTELSNRIVGSGVNVLASSIVLVCRKRAVDAPTVSRREFIRELNAILPEALDEMTKGSGDDVSPVAPVDLSQSIIGPGMAIFSKYAAVLEADGSPMSVHTALQLINRFLAEDDFDADTRFCLHWFEQNGWSAGRFGDADTLSRAKGTSVDGVANSGVVESGGGNVRLLKWSEYSTDWDPSTDSRNPVWETLHHLIRSLKQDGETSAGRMLTDVKSQGESVRQLAYRLYTLCERKGWAEDARAYNELITSWSGIESAAVEPPGKMTQIGLI